MTAIHVMMIMRNEAGRYLTRSLPSARQVASLGGGQLFVTDDCSDDMTPSIAAKYADCIHFNQEPLFWKHEGRARQEHLDFVGSHITSGDWVLSLDADESISDPQRLVDFAATVPMQNLAIGLPLYEFWQEGYYRVDGQWFGTMSSRLFRYMPGAQIPDKSMASGWYAVQQRLWSPQKDVHLLHWGYLNPADRERKYLLYTSRTGGHGHGDMHVRSIIGHPTLRPYP
jgi:hypothetical protein